MAKRIFDEKPISDRFKLYFKKFFMSFSPDSYHQLTELTYRQAFRYLTRTVILSSFILAILILLNLNTMRLGLNTELSKIETCNIGGNLSEPIIFEKQNIVIANQQNYTDETFLISGAELVRKPFVCNVVKPLCFFRTDPVRTDLSIINENPELLSNYIFVALVLMLPSLLFIFLVFYLLKSSILIAAMSLIAFAAVKIFKYKLSYKRLFMAATFAFTPYLVAEPFDITLFNLYNLHFVAFIILFIIAIVLLTERKHRYDHI